MSPAQRKRGLGLHSWPGRARGSDTRRASPSRSRVPQRPSVPEAVGAPQVGARSLAGECDLSARFTLRGMGWEELRPPESCGFLPEAKPLRESLPSRALAAPAAPEPRTNAQRPPPPPPRSLLARPGPPPAAPPPLRPQVARFSPPRSAATSAAAARPLTPASVHGGRRWRGAGRGGSGGAAAASDAVRCRLAPRECAPRVPPPTGCSRGAPAPAAAPGSRNSPRARLCPRVAGGGPRPAARVRAPPCLAQALGPAARAQGTQPRFTRSVLEPARPVPLPDHGGGVQLGLHGSSDERLTTAPPSPLQSFQIVQTVRNGFSPAESKSLSMLLPPVSWLWVYLLDSTCLSGAPSRARHTVLVQCP